MSSPFQVARRQHAVLARAAEADPGLAGDLWAAVSDSGEPSPGSYAEAVRDTIPAERAAILAVNDVAKAYAFNGVWCSAPRYGEALSALGLRDRARAAWSTFEERAASTAALSEGFGWSLSEAWTSMGDVALATGDTSGVERIARLAGRMYAALRGARSSRVAGMPEEVHSIELGNCIPRLLPSELAQLADPELELPVLLRITERRAAQYAVRGTGQQAKGPLVLVLDESGSMHGERNEWSKAAAVALMRVAFDEKRPVVVLHYSTSVVVREIKPGDAAGVMAMIKHRCHGGTDTALALRSAAEQVVALSKKGAGGADVVLVTDGVDGDTDGHAAGVAWLEKLGARLWTVAIECEIAASNVLRAKASTYIHLGGVDLTGTSGAVALSGAASGTRSRL